MFGNSNVSKLITSFEDLKEFTKKTFKSQSKAYTTLESWATESNNDNAIQDISSKLASIYRRFDADFRISKLDGLSSLANTFKKFKEYDQQIKDEKKIRDYLAKKEVKCYEKIQKCPSNKNIRDLEIKYETVKSEKAKQEMKIFELTRDYDVARSILFKENFKSYIESMQEQNEAERVLLEAMKKLVDQMPDLSSEDSDDLSELKYTRKEETENICKQANKMISSISASSLRKATNPPLSPQKSVSSDSSGYESPISHQEKLTHNICRIQVDGTGSNTYISARPEPQNDQLFPSLQQMNEKYYSPNNKTAIFCTWDKTNAYSTPSAPSMDLLQSSPPKYETKFHHFNFDQSQYMQQQKEISPSRMI